VTELLDANVVCRYLTGDHPEHSERAAELIESDRELRISVLILAEAAHVLRRVYGHPPGTVADALIELVQRENIEAHELETDLVVEALLMCRDSGRVSVPDALLWALARAAAPARVWSFDRRFPGSQIELREPGH
jgi:predicted nucleic acid-binding protein